MPMYYFNLYNHVEVLDDDGTDLINLAADVCAACRAPGRFKSTSIAKFKRVPKRGDPSRIWLRG